MATYIDLWYNKIYFICYYYFDIDCFLYYQFRFLGLRDVARFK